MSVPLVLMYHGFGTRPASEDPHNLFVPEAAFDQQLRALLGRGFRPLDGPSFLAGLRSGRWPARSFLVTIDDGYVSTLEVAAPVLGRLDVPAVLFALPGMLGATSSWMPEMPHERLLDAEGLARLPGMGVSIGLHGWDHRSMAALATAELHRQTTVARAALAEVTGEEAALFAYPFGSHDAAARKAVADAGMSAAFAIYDSTGPFALPRVDINALDTPRTFALKTSGWYPRLKSVLDRAPALRRLGHSLAGKARR
ncbi:polysaccharide deacetylase family protein [Blastococcus saxobsidens]|uniref:Polysaccharide deacetylase family protein n=1 Tax=Blastococcus saxobsidens TaxID=138336 RepID=A0A6L9VWY6_9ACTN|nr:polysaccharide deacetylase family protein [Blastococcus saxobsidens]NEK84285.1 polysaccharide deacetylase family protein [Blastococcus saxobsidens]